MISVAVGALEGKLEVYLETADASSEPILIDPTYQGLTKLWGIFQLLGAVPVYLLPELDDPSLTGLPRGLSARALVGAAQTLGGAGLRSCHGGEA